MTSRKPVNRLTPKRQPGAEQQSRTGASRTGTPRNTPVRKPRVTGTSRPVGKRQARAEQRPEPARARTARVRAPRSNRSFWTLVAGCLIAAVLLGGFAVVAALRPGVDDSNRAFVDNKTTEEVRAAADHALRTVYAYDVKNIDGYRDAAKQVLTGKMLADLDKYADTTISAVKQAQTSADAKADPIGVTLLADDRAELLVNLVVSATKNGVAQQSVAGPIVLHMQKVGDRWLASDIVDQ
ncbi:hypothetical protein NBRGN_113_01470 [Nocardia brasiliensis NBRC 14402]|uniref:hypothetical protein n=1 Tax=Nocardia brasiliensis TaxID=37326 RepID=UPI00030069DC|nr:hypothetical protein [Nocardia brasiliensis]ASF11403.1 hypothetical protein CEQ30_33270 [Nocardia brasiliensis]GAJ87090.1 hypothetical protein NBRGN_113_01470 [Nocardia brasiliensis NBRC 14402]SUB09850.1 Uncharacterised protein [Nocardia brasiliensis]